MWSTFETLVAELTRDANHAQPQDALQWCSNWFQQRLEGQRARIRGELAQLPAYRTSLPKDHSVDTVRADLKSNHLVTKCCPLLPWISGVAAGVLVGPD